MIRSVLSVSVSAAAVLFAAILFAPTQTFASSDGRTDGATDCAPCHGSTATGSVSVSISGDAILAPGATGNYTLSIGAVGAGGALNVAVSSTVGTATLGVSDANTKLDGGELTHVDAFTSQPAGNTGDWLYDFTVTAPNNLGAVVMIAAVGMQFDGDFDNGVGDEWNSASVFSVLVPEPVTGSLLAGGLLGLFALSRGSRV